MRLAITGGCAVLTVTHPLPAIATAFAAVLVSIHVDHRIRHALFARRDADIARSRS